MDDAIKRAQAIAAQWKKKDNNNNDSNTSIDDTDNNNDSNGTVNDANTSALGKRKSADTDLFFVDKNANKRPNNDMKVEKVYVPVNERKDIKWVGLICGPKGSNIKRIRAASGGCEVKVRGKGSSKDGTDETEEDLHVVLEGTNAQIDIAKGMIEDLIKNPDKVKAEQLQSLSGGISASYHQLPQPNENDPLEEMFVPQNTVGAIIGRQGEKIRELQIVSGASIQMQRDIEMQPGQQGRRLTIRGTKEKIEKAKELINKTIEDFKREGEMRRMGGHGGNNNNVQKQQVLRGGPIHKKVRILDNTVGQVIGKGGSTINHINGVSGAFLNIPSQADETDMRYRTITICGPTEESCQLAQDEMVKVLQQIVARQNTYGNNANLPAGHESVKFHIPNVYAGRVIGKQGSTINRLKHQFNVRLNIERDVISTEKGQMRNVSISGLKTNVENCKLEIAGIISPFSQEIALDLAGGDRSRLSRSRSNDPSRAYYNNNMMHHQQMGMMGGGGAAVNPNNPYAAQWAAYYAQQAILQQQQQQQQQQQVGNSIVAGNPNEVEDPERERNLDPNNPYRQQWVLYYQKQDEEKAAAIAAAATSSMAATTTTTTTTPTITTTTTPTNTSNGTNNHEKGNNDNYSNVNNVTNVNQNEQQQQQQNNNSNDATQQQQETNSNADADAIAEQWARYYEANPEEAIKNGYTKQHYDQYLMQKQKT